MIPAAIRHGRHGLGWLAVLLSLWTAPCFAVTCPNGAMFDDAALCRFLIHFVADPRPLDQRIATRVGVKTNDESRSIAMVIAIDDYPNMAGASLPPAKKDLENLTHLLVDTQMFDEVIVLTNKDATPENIRYFLETYVPTRVLPQKGKSRFLFAYSGHGVDETTRTSAALVLSEATDMSSDFGHQYKLASLRESLQALALQDFQVLPLINACYSGAIFDTTMGGGNLWTSNAPGAHILTAGAVHAQTVSLGGPTDGSLFFDLITRGIITGAADDYPVVADENGQIIQHGGITRLGSLTGYVTSEYEKVNDRHIQIAGGLLNVSPPWLSSILSRKVSEGAFFFLSPITRLNLAQAEIVVPPGPRSSLPGRPDIKVFGSPPEYPVKGIDVSHFEGDIDWKRVSREGLSFVYIRAISGHSPDTRFEQNWKLSGAVGIPHGAYFLLTACETVAKQADAMIHLVPVEEDALPPAISIESQPPDSPEGRCQAAMSSEQRKGRLLEMLSLLQSHYRKTPLVYGNRFLLSDLSDERFRPYMIWLASYNRLPPVLPGRNPWSIWQYRDDATIDGIGKNVDRNVFFGSQADFAEFRAGKGNVALQVVNR